MANLTGDFDRGFDFFDILNQKPRGDFTGIRDSTTFTPTANTGDVNVPRKAAHSA